MLDIYYASKIVIILVFVLSLISKLADFKGFIDAMKSYNILKNKSSLFVFASAFVLLEISIIGFALFSLSLWTLIFGLTLLSFYFIAVLISLIKKSDINCHCFSAVSSEKITAGTLTRILLISTFLILHYQYQPLNPSFNSINVYEFLLILMLSGICFFINHLLQIGLDQYKSVKKQFTK